MKKRMQIVDGRYTIEDYAEHGINFKSFRMAVIIDDGYGFTDLVTTAIVMQMDGNRGYAVKIEGARYLDSFGDRRYEFLNDKLIKDFSRYLDSSEKKVREMGGTMSDNMAVHVEKFLDNKMKISRHATWDLAYGYMNEKRYGDRV